MWGRLKPRVAELLRRAGLGEAQPGVVLAGVALVALLGAWSVWRYWPAQSSGSDPVITESAATEAAPAEEPSATPPPLVVHVVGAVRHPGVYTLGTGARVTDAVEAAGGALPDAVTAAVNLARVVVDGEQIVVPSEDDAASPPVGAAPAASASTPAVVNINTADETALDSLPGVGPSTAAKIIAEREANGPFSSLEDLGRVSGIGPKKIEQLKGIADVR